MKKIIVLIILIIPIILSACSGIRNSLSASEPETAGQETIILKNSMAPKKTVTPTMINPLNDYVGSLPINKNAEPFSVEDTVVLGVELRMSETDALTVLGECLSTKVNYDYAIGTARINSYLFGNVCFVDPGDGVYSIHEIVIDKPGYKGPRGIEVGMSMDSIITAFIGDFETVAQDQIIFYRLNTGSRSDTAVPPSATLWQKDDHAWRLVIIVPEGDSTYEQWGLGTMEAIESSYMYCSFYVLGFDIEDGSITQMDLMFGPLAE